MDHLSPSSIVRMSSHDGRPMMTEEVTSSSVEIDLCPYPPGVYIIEIMITNHITLLRKVVKQ